MLPLLCFIPFATFVVCVLLTPLARFLAIRWGLVDRPDARRKIHASPIPLAGGIAILLSVCLVLGTVLLLSGPLQDCLAEHASLYLGLLLAAVAICALGVLDDFRCLRGRHKLLGQLLAIGIVVALGVQIHTIHLFGQDIELGLLGLPVTFLWLLVAVNSLNLLDGMDGLLSIVGAIIMAAMAAMALVNGHWLAACVAMSFAAALLGFLCYNFPPASVYLGDAGSMLTGLVVGVLAIQTSLKGPATVALIAPLGLLTIPFLDTLAAIVRRKLTGRSIYTTDRGHLHHCLLRRGLSPRRVLLLVALLSLLAAAGALGSMALRHEIVAIIATVAVIAILVVTRLFGNAELELFTKRVARVFASFMEVPGEGKSRKIEVHLQGTADWKGLLAAVTEQAFVLNLYAVRLDVSAPVLHEEYHADWVRFDGEVDDSLLLWRVAIPLTVQDRTLGRLRVAGYHDAEPLAEKVARLTDIMTTFVAAQPPSEVPCTVAKAADRAAFPPGSGG